MRNTDICIAEIAKHEIKNSDPEFLIRAMISVVGIKKTKEIFSYYYELLAKDEDDE